MESLGHSEFIIMHQSNVANAASRHAIWYVIGDCWFDTQSLIYWLTEAEWRIYASVK